MGIETAIVLGLTAAKAYSDISAAKKEGKAITQQASRDALAKAKETQMKTSRAKVSFLNSGLTLEGTPELSLQGILDAGSEDIATIATNANTKSKNLVRKARTDAILSLGKAGATAGMGAMAGGSGNWADMSNGGWYATQAEADTAAANAGITWKG